MNVVLAKVTTCNQRTILHAALPNTQLSSTTKSISDVIVTRQTAKSAKAKLTMNRWTRPSCRKRVQSSTQMTEMLPNNVKAMRTIRVMTCCIWSALHLLDRSTHLRPVNASKLLSSEQLRNSIIDAVRGTLTCSSEKFCAEGISLCSNYFANQECQSYCSQE